MSELAETLLAEAKANLARNELSDAARLAREVLGSFPEVPSALVILGISAVLAGHAGEALPFLRLALALRPDEAPVHLAVSMALRESGDVKAACHHAAAAVRAEPGNAKYLRNYAYTQYCAKQQAESVAAYHALRETGNWTSKDHRELIRALIELNRLDEAETELNAALTQDPNDPEAVFTHAHLLVMQKKGNQAIARYRRAIELNPGKLMAYLNCAAIAVTGGNSSLAARMCRSGLAAPGGEQMAGLYVNYSLALAAMGKSVEAVEALDHATKLDPFFPKADGNRLFFSQYLDHNTPDDIYNMHREWNQRHVASRIPAQMVHTNTQDPERRLRIGYVSPDFRGHSCAFFLWGLYGQHDHEKFEIVSYNTSDQKDYFTDYFREKSDLWRDLDDTSDEKMAELVRADGIDILIDLAGHSARNRVRVFARKPAPVQVTWLGYPTTTGLDTIDWRLSDDILTPLDTGERFSERLYRLPRISHCYTMLDTITPESVPPPVLVNGYITFGSFNSFAKISDSTLRLWAAVLQKSPGSRLRLKSRSIGNSEAADHIISRFAAVGGDADRLDMTGGEEYTQHHLARYGEIDIALDTTPYGGMTTSCESLIMGVPVITLAGDRTASRYTTALLHAIGLDDLAAPSPEAFATIAAGLAADRDRLVTLRSSLRDRMRASPLCDEVGFTRAMETAYRDMWSHWCQGHSSKA